MQLDRLALRLDLDGVTLAAGVRIGAQQPNDIGIVDDELLLESEHLQVEAEARLEYVDDAEVRVLVLDLCVDLALDRAAVNPHQLVFGREPELGPHALRVHCREGGPFARLETLGDDGAHAARELRNALGEDGG